MRLLHTVAILRCWMLVASQVVCRIGYSARSRGFMPIAAQWHESKNRQVVAFLSSATLQWTHKSHSRRSSALLAVPKKKPSKRRTRIRKTAWMKRYPLNWKRPMMLDMFDVVKYTDGTLTKARTTHEGWLNLPNTTLDGTHFLTKEIRPRW